MAGYGVLHLLIPLLPEQVHRVGHLVPYLLLGIGLTQILILFRFQRWLLLICGLIVGLLFWKVT